jgi:hypothetical protein
MRNRFRTSSPIIWNAVALAPLVGAFVTYLLVFGDLFPLVEYRQWIQFPPLTLSQLLYSLFDWYQYSSREFPIYAVGLADRLCGGSYACDDAFLLLILSFAGAFTVIAIGVLARWRHPVAAAIAVGFIAFSEPWLDSASWQATAHDRFIALFSALAIIVYVVILRVGFAWRVLVGNTVLLGVIVIAYSSKESAFALLPSLLLLGFLAEIEQGWVRSLSRSIISIMLPLAYGLFVFLRLIVRERGQLFGTHNLGGNPSVNLHKFVGYFLNVQAAGVTETIVVVLFVLAAAVCIWRARHEQPILLIGVWGVISFVLSIIPALFTYYGAPFYMIVPGIYLIAFLYAALSAASVVGVAYSPTVRAVGGFALVIFCAQHLLLFRQRLDIYGRVAAQSKNFTSAFSQIAAATKGLPEPVVALYPRRNYLGYMFVDHGKLGRYLFGRGTKAARSFDERFSYATFERDPREIVRKGSIRIIFDENMDLLSIEKPSQ